MSLQTYPAILDYSNRQIDIELLQSILKPGVDPQRVNLAVVTKSPKIVTGMEKLVQRYTLLLLTRIGEIHFDPTSGSSLMDALLSGTIQSKGNLLTLFSLANLSVMRTINQEDSLTDIYGDMPLDEQLQSANLTDASVDTATATVYLNVSLTTKAGSNMEFIIPTTTPR